MNQTQFEHGVKYSERYLTGSENEFIDKRIINSKLNFDGLKILDFGCGMGGMSSWYANTWNCEVLGLDIDENHIKVANHIKNKHNIENVTFFSSKYS